MTTKTATQGTIKISDTHDFHWMISGEKCPEIYGWVEDEYRRQLKGTNGWYRTTDPQVAMKHAIMAIDALFTLATTVNANAKDA